MTKENRVNAGKLFSFGQKTSLNFTKGYWEISTQLFSSIGFVGLSPFVLQEVMYVLKCFVALPVFSKH